MSRKAVISVPVATVWTSFDSAREIDKLAVSRSIDIQTWLESLTYETRLELCDRNLVQSQALFGQEVTVIEEREGWSHVVIPEQASSKDDEGYPGWIPSHQLVKSKEQVESTQFAIVTRPFTDLYNEQNQKEVELSFQTTLPVLREYDEVVEVWTPNGKGYLNRQDIVLSSTSLSKVKGSGDDIVKSGELFLGLPYLWGGMSSYGYDCSGFSYTMCKANGYLIPRDAHDQAAEGEDVPFDQLKRGDLLFFANDEGKGNIRHVGIYYGDGKMIHSPKTGRDIEILSLESTTYEKELCAARRYWQEAEA
ncbi:C40 family peptidase [Bacillus sp. CGMCC 1.16541]|uniref:C40 family peptidase n=1 Tax=Bacillus sp. CGMCC 1.16541 TaxID=2185143 RepID=UPI000D726D05|nr:C40 family peptidase [Bacillus sp. CGMCC 1.16541]